MKTWDFPCSLIPGLWWDCLLRRWFVSGHIGCPTFSSLPITVVRNSILPYPFLQPCPFLAGDVIQATSPRQAFSLAATFVNFFAICLPLYSTSIFMKKKKKCMRMFSVCHELTLLYVWYCCFFCEKKPTLDATRMSVFLLGENFLYLWTLSHCPSGRCIDWRCDCMSKILSPFCFSTLRQLIAYFGGSPKQKIKYTSVSPDSCTKRPNYRAFSFVTVFFAPLTLPSSLNQY